MLGGVLERITAPRRTSKRDESSLLVWIRRWHGSHLAVVPGLDLAAAFSAPRIAVG
jgi:hypothetical protein